MVTPRSVLELGRGGVGVVHLAVRGPGRELVVKKTLRRELVRNVAVRRMFVEEARVASLVRHRAVVTVDDFGVDDDGAPWLTMPWTPGISLQTIVETATVPVDLHVWMLGELLSGLSAVHGAVGVDGKPLELVHRDVSPHNVLVTYDGDVKLLDFGIAKSRDSAVETTTGTVKGKATYMAPEQLGRRRADARADLFAVGVMLWQAIAGRRLWSGLNELEIFDRLSRGDVPPLDADLDASESARAVVARALMPDPSDRFVDADEMRAAMLCAWPPPNDARRRVRRHLEVAFHDERRELERRIERSLPLVELSSPPVALQTDQTRTVAPRRPRQIMRRWLARAALAAGALGAGGLTLARVTGAPADAHGLPRAAQPAPPLVCVDDGQCGVDQLCTPTGACVSLANERCALRRPSHPAQPSGRPFHVGLMLPTSGALGTSFGQFSAHAAELAADEINRLAGGVPFGGERHPVTLVVCDDTTDERASALHLAAHVPAVIGFRASDEAITLSRDVFLPKGMLVLSAMNASPLLAQLDAGQPRRLLRTRSSASSLVPKLVHAITERVAPSLARPGGRQLGVAVLRTGNATGLAFADQLMRALAGTPGVRATEVAAGADVVDRQAVDALMRLSPAVVVTVSDGLFETVVAPYEQALATAHAPPPVHLASWVWEGDVFARFIAEAPTQKRRFLSLGPSPRDPAVMGLVARFRERFADRVTEATVSPAPYDSVYLAAYAAAAARSPSPTGGDLARGIDRLRRGPPLEVGPTHVVEGMRRLARGDEIGLVGVGSRFDFDAETGDASTSEALLCTSYDASTNAVDAEPAPPNGLCP